MMAIGKPFLRAAGLATMLALPFTAQASAAPSVPAGTGYTISLFAAGNVSGCVAPGNAASPTCYYNADSLTNDSNFVYAGYQNSGAADGSSGSGIVAKYSQSGGAALAFSSAFSGKMDGLRVDPFTGQLWVLNNEDANPMLRILDPATMAVVFESALPTNTPFSGGYDDLAFTPFGTFMSASNPGTNKNGTNNRRAVVRVDISSGSVVLNPVLNREVVATDRSTGAQIKVSLTDPDGLSLVPGTNTAVLDGQGDSTLLFFDYQGGEATNVSALFLQPSPTTACGNPPSLPAVPCPPIVDETTWVPATGGHLLVADHAKPGAVYSVWKTGGFTPGTAYTSVSSDNPTLAKTLGTLDTTTGVITPAVTGFSGPKALIFIP